MALRRQHLFQHALAGFQFYWIQNRFFGHADTLLTEVFQYLRFCDATQSFELNVANDRQLFDFKDDADAAAWRILRGDTGADLVKESERQTCLQIARALMRIVGIARPSLSVIANVFFARASSA